MHIDTYYDGVEIHRDDKIIYARFLVPHQVISTCRAAGGIQTELGFVYNHQSCEPSGHHKRLPPEIYRDADGYRKLICDPYGLPPEKCATLGTAANMHNAAFKQESYKDLTVVAVCTGGVEANAGRAGDPASVHETPDGFETVTPEDEAPGPGTINTMIFINKPLTTGALTRVVMTATEAKTAVLQELAVNSRYSDGLATGTGTDQIAVSAVIDPEQTPLTSAGKHAKLGELIGKSVYKAIKETLKLQNSLTPEGQCSAKIHLERFGIDRNGMRDKIAAYLPGDTAEVLRNNFTSIEKDPPTAAAVAALVHLMDKTKWGVLPGSCRKEIFGSYAAHLACIVGGDFSKMPDYMEALSFYVGKPDNEGFLSLVCRAMAMGYQDKWE